MLPITPAQLILSEQGVPWSDAYGDIYHSAAGALAQAEHVFLRGNNLPERWTKQECFVIVETGFGLGLNFLATWQAWRALAAPRARVHFISVEKHPFVRDDLRAAHQGAGVPEALSHALLAQWPALVSGCHRLHFEDGALTLTLVLGDAQEQLSNLVARADAIYLDGFAPACNPQMWSADVFRALASLSDRHTTLATWSVSGAVREGLRQAGFVVEKTQGFSGKREMLRGHYRGERPRPARTARRAIVVGAGLAGTGVAERLAARGWQVSVLEAQPDAAQGASGNLAGAFRPLPSKDDNRISRITRAGFLYALRHLYRLQDAGHAVVWDHCGVLHLARNSEQEAKQKAVVATLALPPEVLRWVSAEEATRLAGHTAAFGGWWFAQGGWVQPGSLCGANLALAGEHVTLKTGMSVARVSQDDGQWYAWDATGQLIDQAPVLVLANAHDAKRLAQAPWLPLQAARGQVSHLPMAQLAPLNVVVCGQGYITPGIGGHAALGASFVVDDFDLGLREDEHIENLSKLERMLPGFAHNMDNTGLGGRVSLRPVSIDRLPMVGAMPAITHGDGYNLDTLPRQEGLWLVSGFGARGLVWSTLCAELAAAQICGEPLPLERDLVQSLDPARFVLDPADKRSASQE